MLGVDIWEYGADADASVAQVLEWRRALQKPVYPDFASLRAAALSRNRPGSLELRDCARALGLAQSSMAHTIKRVHH